MNGGKLLEWPYPSKHVESYLCICMLISYHLSAFLEVIHPYSLILPRLPFWIMFRSFWNEFSVFLRCCICWNGMLDLPDSSKGPFKSKTGGWAAGWIYCLYRSGDSERFAIFQRWHLKGGIEKVAKSYISQRCGLEARQMSSVSQNGVLDVPPYNKWEGEIKTKSLHTPRIPG